MDAPDEANNLAVVRAVLVTCRACGTVRLGVDQIGVRTCLSDATVAFHFRCPDCRLAETGAVATEAVALLRAAGVCFVEWVHPLELSEPHNGDPISLDELAAVQAVLDDDAQLNELLDELRRDVQQ
jgi:hypothetical protein